MRLRVPIFCHCHECGHCKPVCDSLLVLWMHSSPVALHGSLCDSICLIYLALVWHTLSRPMVRDIYYYCAVVLYLLSSKNLHQKSYQDHNCSFTCGLYLELQAHFLLILILYCFIFNESAYLVSFSVINKLPYAYHLSVSLC